MSAKLSLRQINAKATEFLMCHKTSQIESLLHLKRMQLTATAFDPQYYYFKIRKPKGGYREIEAPETELKKVQRKINEYLQYVYYELKTDAAYGFIINPKRKQARNIVTNARQHLGNNYMLNLDFDDFFHQISKQDIIHIFSRKPFDFEKNTIRTLAKICTNNERLPMGAPTSPVLSNFHCIDLDNALLQWSRQNHIIYTRFVDDLTFSSKKEITTEQVEQIENIIQKHQLKIERAKTKIYNKNDIKTVTGIIVGKEKLTIDRDYYTELDKDLERLQKSIELNIITGHLNDTYAIKKFKQELMGKINFIAIVLGYENQIYNNYLNKFETASNPPDKDILSMRWTKFSNYNF